MFTASEDGKSHAIEAASEFPVQLLSEHRSHYRGRVVKGTAAPGPQHQVLQALLGAHLQQHPHLAEGAGGQEGVAAGSDDESSEWMHISSNMCTLRRIVSRSSPCAYSV